MKMNAEARSQALALELGHDFSGEIKTGGNYTPVQRDGHQLWVSGLIPPVGDEALHVGAAVVLDWVATLKAGTA